MKADLPQSTLINSSFALPLCPPEVFHPLWHRITRALEPGGRFAGQFFGTRDSWNTGPDAKDGFTFLSAQGARDLLAPFETEMFEEEEDDSTTPRGKRKHWHVFNIVARKP